MRECANSSLPRWGALVHAGRWKPGTSSELPLGAQESSAQEKHDAPRRRQGRGKGPHRCARPRSVPTQPPTCQAAAPSVLRSDHLQRGQDGEGQRVVALRVRVVAGGLTARSGAGLGLREAGQGARWQQRQRGGIAVRSRASSRAGGRASEALCLMPRESGSRELRHPSPAPGPSSALSLGLRPAFVLPSSVHPITAFYGASNIAAGLRPSPQFLRRHALDRPVRLRVLLGIPNTQNMTNTYSQ
jgi:hypothetical protein